ncbi:MAG: hypothetical protein WCD53_25930 [Microcoleus sp.]
MPKFSINHHFATNFLSQKVLFLLRATSSIFEFWILAILTPKAFPHLDKNLTKMLTNLRYS